MLVGAGVAVNVRDGIVVFVGVWVGVAVPVGVSVGVLVRVRVRLGVTVGGAGIRVGELVGVAVALKAPNIPEELAHAVSVSAKAVMIAACLIFGPCPFFSFIIYK